MHTVPDNKSKYLRIVICLPKLTPNSNTSQWHIQDKVFRNPLDYRVLKHIDKISMLNWWCYSIKSLMIYPPFIAYLQLHGKCYLLHTMLHIHYPAFNSMFVCTCLYTKIWYICVAKCLHTYIHTAVPHSNIGVEKTFDWVGTVWNYT